MAMIEKSNIDQKSSNKPKPVVLVVLDGWGIAQPFSGNAISLANTPAVNGLIMKYPSTTLRASGEAVGLPWGEAGNSEVGHLNLGLGRIVYQDLPRINRAISDNSFNKNPALISAFEHAKEHKSKIHLMGLVSNGGVHSSIEHLYALLSIAKDREVEQVFIHVFLDGRDTQYNSGVTFIRDLQRNCASYGVGKIATISGRFYAMDRDNHWERIEKTYFAMTEGKGNQTEDPAAGIEESYAKKIYDEEFVPTVITENNSPVARVQDGDSMIFFNYRPDRAREITKAFVLPGLSKFNRPHYLKNLYFACFTEYEKKLPVEIAFPLETYKNSLGDVLAHAGMRQYRIAETEKYAHVTYFFNGGKEEKSAGEEHELVPSPRVDNYKDKPEMSASEVTEKLLKAIEDNVYNFILVNYANADMVGHTGEIKSAIKAVEAVDGCLSKVVKAVLKKGGVLLITADHGNAEIMFNLQTGVVDKEHTTNPVPFILVGEQYEGRAFKGRDSYGSDLSLVQPQGILSDIAPTILSILGLPQPPEMTGRPIQ
jgi:2,3-bisphosphoglycerate-independent phosphoglycerate mutase